MTTHTVKMTSSLTKVSVGWHPANRLEGDNSQQPVAHKGADPREKEEEPHDGALHGLGGCRIGKLQTCITESKGADICWTAVGYVVYKKVETVYMLWPAANKSKGFTFYNRWQCNIASTVTLYSYNLCQLTCCQVRVRDSGTNEACM